MKTIYVVLVLIALALYMNDYQESSILKLSPYFEPWDENTSITIFVNKTFNESGSTHFFASYEILSFNVSGDNFTLSYYYLDSDEVNSIREKTDKEQCREVNCVCYDREFACAMLCFSCVMGEVKP